MSEKVALEALKEQQTLVELCVCYSVLLTCTLKRVMHMDPVVQE
jgi:hypothetical protein